MAGSTSSRRNPKAGWRRELVILAAVVVLSTAVFWVSNLDIGFSRLFYKPGSPEGPWPYYENTLWRALYKSDTYLTLMLSAIAIIMILAGALRSGRRALARYSS